MQRVRCAVWLGLLAAHCCGLVAGAQPDIKTWTTPEVATWIRGQGGALGEYADAAARHDIDGSVLLSRHMGDAQWADVGIHDQATRHQLIRAIDKLRDLVAATEATTNRQNPSSGGASDEMPSLVPFLDSVPDVARSSSVGGDAHAPGDSALNGTAPLHDGLPQALVLPVNPHVSFQELLAPFPRHNLVDEASFPIGNAGISFYQHLPVVYQARGLPWDHWQGMPASSVGGGAHDGDSAGGFLELGDPEATGLLASARHAWGALEASDFHMDLPSESGSPMSIRTRGTPLLLNLNKLTHDRDQLQLLVDAGKLPGRFQDAVDNITNVITTRMQENPQRTPDSFFLLSVEELSSIGRTMQRLVYMPPDPPPQFLPEPLRNPLNLDINWTAVEQQYFDSDPGVLVVDNFLTAEAVENIRRLCLESTLFWDVRSSYVGAYIDEGLGNHVVFRVIEEFRRVMPRLVGDLPLQTLWAYKYFDDQPGIKKHCDDADLNINFWLSPDDANLDPDTGGLVVYLTQPPSNWTFDDFQMMPQSQINLQNLIDESDAGFIRVPHRNNRIVIFNSTLVHESDAFTFKAGYKNRRINFTFLFGNRKWAGRPRSY